MSIFRRGKGAFAYQDALDVTGVHFKRMDSILKSWEGDHALVRFDPKVYREDLRQAVPTCGLAWREEVLAEVYDATCRHHEAGAVTHEAQTLFESLGGLSSDAYCRENLARVERDAAARENILRTELEQRRQEIEQYRQEIEQHRQQAEQYRQEIEQHRQEAEQYGREVEALQQVREQLEAALAMIKETRTWRLRQQVISTLRSLRIAG